MAKVKQLKKNWYPIVGPTLFRNMILGETTVYDPQAMVGKHVSVNLMTLTGNARAQNTKVNFKVSRIHDNHAMADFIGYQVIQSSIKRMVRRNVEKLDDSFVCKTTDGVALRVKPVMVTRGLVSASLATALRKGAQQAIASQAASQKFDAFAGDIIFHKTQDILKKQLSKIYPLKAFEIKYMGITKDGAKAIKAVPQAVQPAEPQAKQAQEPEAPVQEAQE